MLAQNCNRTEEIVEHYSYFSKSSFKDGKSFINTMKVIIVSVKMNNG